MLLYGRGVDWGQAVLTLTAVVVGAAASTAGSIAARRHDRRQDDRLTLIDLCREAGRVLGEQPSGMLNDQEQQLVEQVAKLAHRMGSWEYRLSRRVVEPMRMFDDAKKLSPAGQTLMTIQARDELGGALEGMRVDLTIRVGPFRWYHRAWRKIRRQGG